MEEISKGALYVVATPLGNLSDLSPRASAILAAADLIAAEDTRSARKLLPAAITRKKLVSYFAPKEEEKITKLLRLLKEGKTIALISEAGTPCISDPGSLLVANCQRQGIKVIPVPGPSALTSALSVSGFKGESFIFLGFLARKGKKRKEQLKIASGSALTVIIYESAKRVIATLKDLANIDQQQNIFIIREISKKFEESFHGQLSAIIEKLSKQQLRGEFVLVLAGEKKTADKNLSATAKQRLDKLYQKIGGVKGAALKFADENKALYRLAYRYLINKKENNN